ncbi:helix-hairpin-helix domain-containing protein [Nonlabens mediterrranea]|uniref:Helix-hairpin-helix domain-containing protein n=1 Tax=Nonlabens mediterrranea TaxID=1419947 RepID=A0ABS0A880_9FLAO|nr:helix-hairpin-helix domain-containing protein [Nonlabens mediterrranea]MBF4985579.1 helix-hairpin-helix domain-containing protein [Nonlabens mediterrranea]
MKNLKSLFLFNRKQQRGIFVLIILLIIVVVIYIVAINRSREHLILEDISEYQSQIDSLKNVANLRKNKIYPFNPNYITDYRGYVLGMSEAELDKLHRFRESNKWINSKKDFQNVTGVSDQWLDSISPYFKFPEWVTNPKKQNKFVPFKERKVVAKDINTATQDELKAVYGIGPALSGRIIKEREFLKGFIDMRQVRSVYGLTDSTMVQLKKHFYINSTSLDSKIALNTANRDELLSVPYFNDYLVDQLLKQRTLREGFKSWDKVVLTSRFPEEKLELIQLYLTLD